MLAELSPAEQRYNIPHIRTRTTIEKLFSQLKNKFRCCLNGINVNLDTAKNMIVAIAVLFKIAKEKNVQLFTEENEYNIDNEDLLSTKNENKNIYILEF